MQRLGFALGVLVLVVMAPPAHAQILIDYPVGGMLHHQTDPSAVLFDCSRLSENRISCTFTQFKAYIVGYPSVDESLGTLWPTRDEKACADARAELAEVMRRETDRTPKPTPEEADRLERLKANVEYCDTGNREVFREQFTHEHERHQKNCTISAHFYTQTFRRASNAPGSRRWVTETPPNGECKLHLVAEFYEERDEFFYVAASKVLNKSARSGELGCHEITEQEAIFGPRNEAASRMACETVDFSPGCFSPNFPCLGPPPVAVH